MYTCIFRHVKIYMYTYAKDWLAAICLSIHLSI